MIIKLSKAEQKTLSALDPKGKGPKPWQTAREVGGGVFRKKPENLKQEEIRSVRNGFRKLVREGLVEMNSTNRGQYRISDKGRKVASSGKTEFEGKFERGQATLAAKGAGEARLKDRPKTKAKAKTKPAKKSTAKAKPAKKAAKKAKSKAAPKKAAKKAAKKIKAKPAKKAAKKAATKTKQKVKVVDDSKDSTQSAKGTNGANGERKKPKFKRREALKYANRNAGQ
jgi:DNA-binding PadR family transcriptional regulator